MRFFFELYFYFNGKYLDKRFCCIFAAATGDLVHLVERQVRNLKVAGSSPVISTKYQENPLKFSGFCCIGQYSLILPVFLQ